MPSLGSVVRKLRGADKPVCPCVTLGDLRHFGNNDSLGQNAGSLGKIYAVQDCGCLPAPLRLSAGSIEITITKQTYREECLGLSQRFRRVPVHEREELHADPCVD
jgi:hypothetical protein